MSPTERRWSRTAERGPESRDRIHVEEMRRNLENMAGFARDVERTPGTTSGAHTMAWSMYTAGRAAQQVSAAFRKRHRRFNWAKVAGWPEALLKTEGKVDTWWTSGCEGRAGEMLERLEWACPKPERTPKWHRRGREPGPVRMARRNLDLKHELLCVLCERFNIDELAVVGYALWVDFSEHEEVYVEIVARGEGVSDDALRDFEMLLSKLWQRTVDVGNASKAAEEGTLREERRKYKAAVIFDSNEKYAYALRAGRE